MDTQVKATAKGFSLYPDDMALLEQASEQTGIRNISATVRYLLRTHPIVAAMIAQNGASESVKLVTESAE